MSTGQMLLVLAALVTFSMVALTINQSVITTTETALEYEALNTAENIANTYLNESFSKPYGAKIANGQVIEDPNNFSTCGRGSGEEYEEFNDCDDFDGLSRNDTTARLGIFKVDMEVYFVDPDHPDTYVVYKTNTKKIVVKVTNPYLGINPNTGEPLVYEDCKTKTYPME